ncbi:MAG: hypothetical protein M1819_002017 [Sarea resinae]|nr:MAG: hypothetical protein M1819_002017 [Sarea resinae]
MATTIEGLLRELGLKDPRKRNFNDEESKRPSFVRKAKEWVQQYTTGDGTAGSDFIDGESNAFKEMVRAFLEDGNDHIAPACDVYFKGRWSKERDYIVPRVEKIFLIQQQNKARYQLKRRTKGCSRGGRRARLEPPSSDTDFATEMLETAEATDEEVTEAPTLTPVTAKSGIPPFSGIRSSQTSQTQNKRRQAAAGKSTQHPQNLFTSPKEIVIIDDDPGPDTTSSNRVKSSAGNKMFSSPPPFGSEDSLFLTDDEQPPIHDSSERNSPKPSKKDRSLHPSPNSGSKGLNIPAHASSNSSRDVTAQAAVSHSERHPWKLAARGPPHQYAEEGIDDDSDKDLPAIEGLIRQSPKRVRFTSPRQFSSSPTLRGDSEDEFTRYESHEASPPTNARIESTNRDGVVAKPGSDKPGWPKPASMAASRIVLNPKSQKLAKRTGAPMTKAMDPKSFEVAKITSARHHQRAPEKPQSPPSRAPTAKMVPDQDIDIHTPPTPQASQQQPQTQTQTQQAHSKVPTRAEHPPTPLAGPTEPGRTKTKPKPKSKSTHPLTPETVRAIASITDTIRALSDLKDSLVGVVGNGVSSSSSSPSSPSSPAPSFMSALEPDL